MSESPRGFHQMHTFLFSRFFLDMAATNYLKSFNNVADDTLYIKKPVCATKKDSVCAS